MSAIADLTIRRLHFNDLAMRGGAQAPPAACSAPRPRQCLRQANRGDEAAPVFQEFADKFPTNAHLDVALFRLASLLAKSDKQRAAEAYERVAADPTSKYKGDASKGLEQLK